MAELDKIPQKQSIEIEIAKLDEDVLKSITDLNQKSNNLIADFGQIYIRKREIEEESTRLGEILEKGENDFKSINLELKEILDSLEKEIVVMHPGPINRGVEITSDVADSKQSVILQQVENGVAVRMAVIYLLASKIERQ